MQPFEEARRALLATVAALALSTLAAGGCSSQRLVVVDPPAGVDGDADLGMRDAGVSLQPDLGIQPGLLDGIVGYWRLDDGPSSSARDGSGRGNNGVLISLDRTTAWVPGWSGQGLLTDGMGWVVVPPSASIDSITDSVTVAGWVYLDGVIDLWATMLSRQIGSTIEQHYHVSLNPERRPNVFMTTTTKTALLTAPDPVAPRTWVHLAVTYDGTTARLYVDGVAAPGAMMQITGSFAADTTPVILGGNANDANGVATELFPGRVDELMLYRRALTAEEIARLHAGELLPTANAGRDAGAD
ncbi:MAG TPA: LamG domain-containing protein [Polyangia bacterium]|nr:LamG domain-containing protein [Polyangia bacterium]